MRRKAVTWKIIRMGMCSPRYDITPLSRGLKIVFLVHLLSRLWERIEERAFSRERGWGRGRIG
jgi:hypothetical protein